MVGIPKVRSNDEAEADWRDRLRCIGVQADDAEFSIRCKPALDDYEQA